MDQRKHNLLTLAIVALSLLISAGALMVSWSQHDTDYAHAVMIQPGALPLVRINEGNSSFEFEITNTSKTNLQYFLRARTNMGCIKGANERPLFLPCSYESQIISLSKSDAGKSTYKHTFNLDAHSGAVETSPFAYISPPDYYLTIEIIDASNGRQLYKSECFYAYHVEAKAFGLDQPVVDSSGMSEKRQKACSP